MSKEIEILESQISLKAKMRSVIRIGNGFFSKIILIAIVLSGVLSVTSYIPMAMASYGSPVIVGNTPALLKHENLTPVPQAWEDGIRTDPTVGTYEWWYYQLQATDGTFAQFVFYTKPWFETPLPFYPLVTATITSPNGTSHNELIFYNTNDFSASRNQNNLTIGKNWVHGDLNAQVLHFDSHEKGLGADLVFTRDAPGWQAGNGKWYFDKSLTQYWGWFPAFPSAKVQGTLTYGGQVHKVQGNGYHDHQWGTVDMNKVLSYWYWGQGRLGNYTVIFFPVVTSSDYNYQHLPILYLAKGNNLLVGATSNMTWKASNNQTFATLHRTYPGLLDINYKNGSNTVTLSLTNPKILLPTNNILVTNATTLGSPQYMRFSGTGHLSINMNGKNDTASGLMTWEENFAQ